MNELKLVLKKPYKFEGEEYMEIDLTGLESLNGNDLQDADKESAVVNGASVSPVKEMELGYCLVLAAKAAKKPVEFMKLLPAPLAIAVKNKVTGFLYGSEYLEETPET